jgi:hypothetical protein
VFLERARASHTPYLRRAGPSGPWFNTTRAKRVFVMTGFIKTVTKAARSFNTFNSFTLSYGWTCFAGSRFLCTYRMYRNITTGTWNTVSPVAQSVQCLTTDLTAGVRSPTEAENFSSNLCVQTGSGAHPASCTVDTGGSFPGGVKRGRGVMLTTHPLLVPRLRNSRSCTCCHPDAPLWSVTGPLYLFFTNVITVENALLW